VGYDSGVRAFVLAIVSLAALATPAAAEAPIKVAVIPGIAVNVDAARVDALGQDLANALAAELEVEATGGLEVRRQLPADGLPPDCVAKQDCIADVAKRTGASQLLFMVVVDTGAGGAVQIDSTWIDASSGRSASRPAIDLAPGADPKPRFVAAARAMLPDAKVRPKPKAGIDGKMAPAVPRHYTRGAMFATGGAVVGLGVGIGFGLSARSKYKKCDTDLPPMTCNEESYKGSIRTRALIADVGWVVGISGVVATAILIATSGKEAKLVVEPSAQGVGVSAVGRF
jgi:hypothetical protein